MNLAHLVALNQGQYRKVFYLFIKMNYVNI